MCELAVNIISIFSQKTFPIYLFGIYFYFYIWYNSFCCKKLFFSEVVIMLTALLIVIFISFIGVGLPDSVLGTAWPEIYREFGLPISLAGYISAAVSVGTVLSSLLSAKLIQKLGTGLLSAVSTLLTAAALLGYSYTNDPVFFFLFSIPLGLGAGAVDTALNSFVALHYSASAMSFLHCSYGIGVAVSPFIMSRALGDGGNWRRGYLVVALIQFAIAAVCFISLPIWHRIQKKDEADRDTSSKRTPSIPELIKTPGVLLSCLCFISSCALELTAGAWSSSYFVNTKGIPSDKSAMITMLFYIGLALGRFLSGIFTNKLGRRRILRISLSILPIALLFFTLPLPTAVTSASLFLLGLGIGPIYPNFVHLTPKNFGNDIAEAVMGLQQAMTYLGILVMPWLFGVLAEKFTTVILPYFLILMLIFYFICFISLFKVLKKAKKALS